MCQNELSKIAVQSNGYTSLKIQCAKYGIDLNRDLFDVKAYFILDDQTHQKISIIINRKDKDTFDKQSTQLAKQVLEVLGYQLKQDAKKLGFQQ